MLILATMLALLALADLLTGGVAGSAGRDLTRARRIGLVTVAAALGAAALWVGTGAVRPVVALFAVGFPGALIWVEARAAEGRAGNHPRVALVTLAMTLLIAGLVLPAVFNPPDPPWIASYLSRLPWVAIRDVDPGALSLTVAGLLFLGPTANGIVRTCLQLTRDTPVAEAEQQLKGGRFIGPLERYLIFGLALAGEPTAAALVISAKSIIRFPELQSKATAGNSAETGSGKQVRPVDVLTEYFLLGSLLSWSLALAMTLPVLACIA